MSRFLKNNISATVDGTRYKHFVSETSRGRTETNNRQRTEENYNSHDPPPTARRLCVWRHTLACFGRLFRYPAIKRFRCAGNCDWEVRAIHETVFVCCSLIRACLPSPLSWDENPANNENLSCLSDVSWRGGLTPNASRAWLGTLASTDLFVSFVLLYICHLFNNVNVFSRERKRAITFITLTVFLSTAMLVCSGQAIGN